MNNYNKKPYVVVVVILSIVVIISIIFFGLRLYKNYNSNLNKDVSNTVIDKVYGVNEYNNVIVDDEKMCEIYLANYLSILRNNLSGAYNLVDSSYISDNNFNYDNFVTLITSYNLTNSKVSEYSVSNVDNRKAYIVINSSGNKYIFFPDGVMTYTVKFD